MSKPSRVLFEVRNPQHMVMSAAVALAKARHTGSRCSPCAGHGMFRNLKLDVFETCIYCDGFGRQLRPT